MTDTAPAILIRRLTDRQRWKLLADLAERHPGYVSAALGRVMDKADIPVLAWHINGLPGQPTEESAGD